MKTTNIHTYFFSPTGTSRKIAAAVAQGLAGISGTAIKPQTQTESAAQGLADGLPPVTGSSAAEGSATDSPATGKTATAPPADAGKRGCGNDMPSITAIDLTHPAGQPAPLPSDAVAVFAVPVYGGHVAPAALERLQGIRGAGTPTVVVAVYGNRAFGAAVRELAAFVSERGFVPVAAGAFVGEHSYSTPATPIAAGRPDAQDLSAATAFGEQVRRKLEAIRPSGCSDVCNGNASDTTPDASATETGAPVVTPDSTTAQAAPGTSASSATSGISAAPAALVPVDVAKLREPRTPLLAMLRFIRFVLAYRRRQKRNPVVLLPQGDAARCTQCGRCVALCPTQAIARGDELHTDPARCIRCCACVKGCTFGARTFETPFAAALARNFARRKPPVTLL